MQCRAVRSDLFSGTGISLWRDPCFCCSLVLLLWLHEDLWLIRWSVKRNTKCVEDLIRLDFESFCPKTYLYSSKKYYICSVLLGDTIHFEKRSVMLISKSGT